MEQLANETITLSTKNSLLEYAESNWWMIGDWSSAAVFIQRASANRNNQKTSVAAHDIYGHTKLSYALYRSARNRIQWYQPREFPSITDRW